MSFETARITRPSPAPWPSRDLIPEPLGEPMPPTTERTRLWRPSPGRLKALSALRIGPTLALLKKLREAGGSPVAMLVFGGNASAQKREEEMR